jgi:hypothetical protein
MKGETRSTECIRKYLKCSLMKSMGHKCFGLNKTIPYEEATDLKLQNENKKRKLFRRKCMV